MRLFSIIAALAVGAALYGLVFERERLLSFAGAGQDATVEETAGSAAQNETESAEAMPDDAAIAVVALRTAAETVNNGVVLRGRTEAVRQVEVRAETGGLVISEPLRRGTSIETGDLMCRLDPGTRDVTLSEAEARLLEAQARLPEAQAGLPAARARLLEAKARLAEAQINDNAASRLSQEGFASETRVASTAAAVESAQAGVITAESGVESAQSAIAAARAGIQSAEAGVASVKKDIERLEIRAPFGGILETDTAELGSLVQPGSLCATIIQLNPIKLVGIVPETLVDRVSVGANAGARLASGREIAGQVTFLSRSADATTRTFRVEVEVDNSDLSIRDGQTAEILIQAAGEEAHLIPQSALTLNDEGRLGVRIVDPEQRAAFTPVAVLRDTNTGIWVTGLEPQAEVIVVGQEFVTDGVPVRVTYREDAQ